MIIKSKKEKLSLIKVKVKNKITPKMLKDSQVFLADSMKDFIGKEILIDEKEYFAEDMGKFYMQYIGKRHEWSWDKNWLEIVEQDEDNQI